jgi:hypothetical protein
MVKEFQKKPTVFFSFPLAALMIIAGSMALFTQDFYAKETPNWMTQAVTQDAINVFLITPVLVFTSILALKGKTAFLLWGGVNLYLVYTYAVYCFDIHFNSLFLIYCFSFGLAFYSFVYFLFSLRQVMIESGIIKETFIKITAVYFLFIATGFYFLWLSQILPPILNHATPKDIRTTGLFTNPIHVLDLSLILPAIFLTGILILKRKTLGIVLIPPVLIFFILMDITIAALAFAENLQTGENSYAVILIMGLLSLFSLILLLLYVRQVK